MLHPLLEPWQDQIVPPAHMKELYTLLPLCQKQVNYSICHDCKSRCVRRLVGGDVRANSVVAMRSTRTSDAKRMHVGKIDAWLVESASDSKSIRESC